MASVRYFSGDARVEYYMPVSNQEFAALFPNVRGVKYDSFSRMVGRAADNAIVPITRRIFFKSNPSLHKCGARCVNAKGHDCECSCGGANHGKGY